MGVCVCVSEFYRSQVHVCGHQLFCVCACASVPRTYLNSVFSQVIIYTLNDYKLSFNLTQIKCNTVGDKRHFNFSLSLPTARVK